MIAAALALGIGLVHALTFQTRYYNDGPGLASMHAEGGRVYYHVLYLPVVALFERALGLDDPLVAPRLVSIVPAALGCGLSYLVARLCGAPVFGAAAAVLLLASSPSLWFFGTTVEVHALAFCTAAFVALVTLLAPWRRAVPALLCVAAAFPLLYLAHQSTFVLGPGWVLLVQYARVRHGGRYSARGLLLGVGPALLASLLSGFAVAGLVRFGALAPLWEEFERKLHAPDNRAWIEDRAVWWNEWLLPLGLMVPLALAGAARLRREPVLASALAALIGVPWVFFVWWATLERGGYFLSSSPFLLVPVALLLGRWTRAKGLVALALLAAQATWARARIDAYDEGWDPAERVEQVRAVLGESGLLLTTAGFAPDISLALPGVREESLTILVRQACARANRALPPEEVLKPMKPFLSKLLERHERVAVEIGYRRVKREESPSIAGFTESLRAIEDYLRDQYVVTDHPHEYWTLLRLERRK